MPNAPTPPPTRLAGRAVSDPPERSVPWRLFVTGGAGYVGSIVTELLVERGHEVTVYDNLAMGHRAAVHPRARWVQGDLRDEAALRAALAPETDAVLHFAARSLVSESMRDPAGYYEHNVGASATLLRVMEARRVHRLVFSSSAAVYGEPSVQPIPEDAVPQPTHAYGGSKLSVEMLLRDAVRTGRLAAISLRYFNAAGASPDRGEDHAPETHLIPNVLRSAVSGDAVAIYGDNYATTDGTCVRDYVHVLDLAEGHLRALDALQAGVVGAINLGSGRGTSVREVVDQARAVTGQPLPVRLEPRRPGDPPNLVAAIDRAAAVLRWRPQRDLREIVQSAWRWVQQHPRGYGDASDRREPT